MIRVIRRSPRVTLFQHGVQALHGSQRDPGLQTQHLSGSGPAPPTDGLLVRRGIALRVKIPLDGQESGDRGLTQHGSVIWAGKRWRAPEGLMGNPATHASFGMGVGIGHGSTGDLMVPVWILRKPQASTDDGWLTDVSDPSTCRQLVDRMSPASASRAQRCGAGRAAAAGSGGGQLDLEKTVILNLE